MNELQTLIALVEADYTDDVAAGVLYDAFQELGHRTPEDARSCVDNIRNIARCAAQLARATNLMSAGTRSAGWLSGYIRRFAEAPDWSRPTILVVPGDTAPLHRHSGVHAWWSPRDAGMITVGGGWVCQTWDDHRAQMNARQRYRRLKKKHRR